MTLRALLDLNVLVCEVVPAASKMHLITLA